MNQRNLLLTLLAVVPAVLGQQQAPQAFQCDPSENADKINVTSSSGGFSTITASASCDDCDFLVPEEIYWHVYAIEEGSTPKQSMYPPGLVEAQIRGGTLRYTLRDVLEGYAQGDPVQAGVNLYIPLDMMKNIIVDGVGQWVEVNLDGSFLADLNHSQVDPVFIEDSGVDNHLIVSSPYLKVDFIGSGVGSNLTMEVASNSSLELSGVDQKASINCTEGLEVRMTGVHQEVLVLGQPSRTVMEGVDGEMKINNGLENPCANVERSGIHNGCQSTDAIAGISALSCLSNTTAGYPCQWDWPLSTGESIGLAFGTIFVLSLIVFACIYCICRCCRDSRGRTVVECKAEPHKETTKPHEEATMSVDDHAHAPIVEAEVLEIRNVGDTENQVHNTVVDVEKALPESAAQLY